jgi:tetratricopeptide (TPR) repeat protein
VRIASDTGGDANAARLEWAGEGWLRGKTRPIPPGRVEVVVVRYVEWLSHDGDRMTYRYPMLSEGAPPLLGEFHATIDAGGVDATAIAVSSGMQVVGSSIELRRADFRPASDLVVDFRLRPGALPPTRGYVVPGDSAGSYLLVRSDVGPGRARPVSEPAGVSLALVVDTSRSVGPALLDAERALVLALLEGLGAQDQVVVFAADDRARPLGPETLGPVDAARRKDIQRALSELKPGGATNLGVALERAAGALPGDQPSSTLLYLGDGWPTLGDVSVEALRARLARRSGGLPRLGAIAVGPTANRFGLTALVRGAGPVLSLGDASDAPEVAVHLLAEAMRPAHVGVSVDLGPGAERVYPRGGRTLQDGETLTTVARLRSAPPGSVVLRYADGAGEIREARPLAVRRIEDDGDIRRRWSAGRVLELMLRGGGREAIVDAALANGLLTPWTGFAAVPAGQPYRATALSARMLDAGLDGGLAVFSAGFSTARPAAGALRVAADAPWPEVAAAGAEADAWKRAAAAAARRKLDESLGLVRQCRESRATLRPEVGGILRVELSVSSDGHVASVAVKGASAFEDDAALDRCVELVVKNLGFWGAGSGGAVSVSYEFRLPPGHEVTARACSPTSLLPLPMRRGVWFERLARPETEKNPLGSHGELAYLRAKATCEMPAWSDRRTFLELLLDRAPNGVARAELAARLDEAGDPDAADLARREAVRRAESPEALESIRAVMLANEPDVSVPFVAAYAEARTDEARLATVQRFLRFAPHDSRLLRKELWLLLALGRKDDVLAESVAIRGEPFLDVALLADTASVLRRVGAEDEALRTFGELAERAPDVPFVRALVGDRLADEGLYEEAEAAYEALLRLVPDDGAAELRLALAAAGAGRLDLATRTLSHVAETGGRGSDATISELARMVSSARVALRRGKENDAVVMARLTRRAAELASSDGLGTVLVEGPTWVPGLRVKIERAGSREELTPLRTPLLGLVGLRTERGLGPLRFVLGRQRDLEPARPATVRVEVLVPADGGARLASRDVPLRADGEDTEVVWDGAAFVASAPAAHAPAP